MSFSFCGWQDVKIQLLTSVVSRELLSGEFMSMSLLSCEFLSYLKAMIHFRSRSHRYMMYDQLLWKTTDREVVIVECRFQTCYTLIWDYWYKPSVYPGCYHDCHMKLIVLTRYWTLWLVQLRAGLHTLEKQPCLPSTFHRISSIEGRQEDVCRCLDWVCRLWISKHTRVYHWFGINFGFRSRRHSVLQFAKRATVFPGVRLNTVSPLLIGRRLGKRGGKIQTRSSAEYVVRFSLHFSVAWVWNGGRSAGEINLFEVCRFNVHCVVELFHSR